MIKLRKIPYQFKPTYFKKTKSKKSILFRLFAWGGLFFIFTGGILYLLIFSPIFQINKIQIEGIREIKPEQIEKITRQIIDKKFFNKIPKENPILMPDKEIAQTVLNEFPKIKDIKLIKDIKHHTLVIKIEEREASAIWCQVLFLEPLIATSTMATGLATATSSKTAQINIVPIWPEIEKCFFIDKDGFIFKEAPIISGGSLATVLEQTDQDLKITQTVTNSKILEFILAAKKELMVSNLNLSDFVVQSQSSGELEILAPDGWRIYLDLGSSAASQIQALKRVLEEEIKEKRTLLEYVDLRVQNRVYYKLK